MTAKSDFTPEEWETVLEGPTAAGLMIAASQRGGTFRESYSIAKAYTDARRDHGASQLLDDIVGSKPKVERPHVHSVDELKQQSLEQLRQDGAQTVALGPLDDGPAESQFCVFRSGRAPLAPPRTADRPMPDEDAGRLAAAVDRLLQPAIEWGVRRSHDDTRRASPGGAPRNFKSLRQIPRGD